MSFSRRGTAIWIICIFLTTAGIACAGTQAIGPSDWQYHDLDALSRAGLLNGHPSGPIGEWAGEQLSRFEAASLTLRERRVSRSSGPFFWRGRRENSPFPDLSDV